jgi:hypothetical protein
VGCLDWQEQGLNPPQIVLEQVSAYKTEMDSIAQFVEQECSLEPETRYPASKLYEAYHNLMRVLISLTAPTNGNLDDFDAEVYLDLNSAEEVAAQVELNKADVAEHFEALRPVAYMDDISAATVTEDGDALSGSVPSQKIYQQTVHELGAKPNYSRNAESFSLAIGCQKYSKIDLSPRMISTCATIPGLTKTAFPLSSTNSVSKEAITT